MRVITTSQNSVEDMVESSLLCLWTGYDHVSVDGTWVGQ